MAEDYNVTRIGENWGRASHRKLKVERCENGYIVRHSVVNEDPKDDYHQTMECTRVFITNTDMLEFVERYFSGEPKP